ncbi:hypothetical protein D9M71_656840 [compost metagenome]
MPCTSAGSSEMICPLWLAMALRVLASGPAGRLNGRVCVCACTCDRPGPARVARATATESEWDHGLNTAFS